MNIPIIYEKIATPITNKNAMKILSSSALGWKSPNPTVARLVNAKYIITKHLRGASSSSKKNLLIKVYVMRFSILKTYHHFYF
jgi:hypothetical protein